MNPPISVLLVGAIDELESLRTQLAASSAREARLREALDVIAQKRWEPGDFGSYRESIKRAVYELNRHNAIARAALADPPRPVEGPPCGLCGKPAAGYAVADDVRLCHPDDPEAPDCYTLWTLYKQRPAPAPRGCLLFWAQTCPCAACNARRAAPAPRYREGDAFRHMPIKVVSHEELAEMYPDPSPAMGREDVERALEHATRAGIVSAHGREAVKREFWAALTPNETTSADDGKEGGK